MEICSYVWGMEESERLKEKVECVRCNTCTHIFAMAVEKHRSANWFKDLAKYVKTGNVTIESMTIGEIGDQFGYGIKKCCGRKAKAV